MKKRVIFEQEVKRATLISNGEDALVIRLNNGSVLKIFKNHTLEIFKDCNIDIESKILAATPIKNSPEILIPTSAAYDESGNFIGYTMLSAKGISYTLYNDSLTGDQRRDLKRYAKVHHKIESVLRRNKDMVFPDLCTCNNIFIDNKQNIQFIDYDGIQVKNHRALSLSTALGDAGTILSDKKYFTEDLFYTKELDKKSSIILYFLSTFNIDLTKVGEIDPISGKEVTLDHIFSCINLDDYEICHKVWKIFQNDECNEFLGDDIFRIIDKYDLNIVGIHDNIYLKKLSKKH
jgi:hypothetical protein